MRLTENKYTTKDGQQRCEYKIGKMNEYGDGVTVDTKVDFLLNFEPTIKKINFTTPQGEAKMFDSVKIIAQPSVAFDNVELHPEYRSAVFQLPSNYAPWISECKKGDTITVWLRSFEKEMDGKVRKLSTWDCNVNGANIKSRAMAERDEAKETIKQAVENVQKQEIAPAVQAVVDSPTLPKKAVDHSLPEDKQPQLPVELNEWAKSFETMKEDFKASFCQDGNYPKTFVDWMSTEGVCGTDYVSKQPDDEAKRRTATVIYFALCHRLGL